MAQQGGLNDELARMKERVRLTEERHTETMWREFAERHAEMKIRTVVKKMMREGVQMVMSTLAIGIFFAAVGIAIYFRISHWPAR